GPALPARLDLGRRAARPDRDRRRLARDRAADGDRHEDEAGHARGHRERRPLQDRALRDLSGELPAGVAPPAAARADDDGRDDDQLDADARPRDDPLMAAFACTAINAEGRELSGELSAPTVDAAREQLRSRGLLADWIQEVSAAAGG